MWRFWPTRHRFISVNNGFLACKWYSEVRAIISECIYSLKPNQTQFDSLGVHNSLCTYFPKEKVFNIDSRWRYQNKENYTPPYQNRLFSDLFSFKMQNKHKTLFFKSSFALSGFVAVSIQFYFQYFLDKGTVPLSSIVCTYCIY